MSKVLGNLSRGLVFVLSAPAGTGKTTLVRKLIAEFNCIAESVSCTTRSIRPGEVPGMDYHFLTNAEFQQKREAGDFLECAEVFGHWYGTSKAFVRQQQETGKHVFLIIDTQGALTLRRDSFPGVYVFLSPPSLQILEERLRGRQTESHEVVQHRLSWAAEEIKKLSDYDYHIVNDRLENAYEVLRSIVIAEEHRVKNSSN